MKTTIEMHGIKITHEGENDIVLSTNAPTKVNIETLIAELLTLRITSENDNKIENN